MRSSFAWKPQKEHKYLSPTAVILEVLIIAGLVMGVVLVDIVVVVDDIVVESPVGVMNIGGIGGVLSNCAMADAGARGMDGDVASGTEPVTVLATLVREGATVGMLALSDTTGCVTAPGILNIGGVMVVADTVFVGLAAFWPPTMSLPARTFDQFCGFDLSTFPLCTMFC